MAMTDRELDPLLEAIRRKLEALLALCPWMKGEATVNLDPDDEQDGHWITSVAFPLRDQDGETIEIVPPVDWRDQDECEGMTDEAAEQIETATADLETALLNITPLYRKAVEAVLRGGSDLDTLMRDLDIGPIPNH